jgi:hypothetical protein
MALKFSLRETCFVGTVALCLSAVCLFEVFYIHYLRQKYQALLPQQFNALTCNGSTNLLVPWISMEDELYASKVQQIRLHHYPFNPFIKEKRSLHSGMPDFIALYTTALLCLPFSHVQTAWAVIPRLMMGAWFLLLYFILRHSLGKNRFSAPILALAALFPLCFVDALDYVNVNFSFPNPGLLLYKLIFFGFRNRSMEFLRMTPPFITMFFMFSWFLAVLYFLSKSKRSWGFALSLGVAGALLAFVHFFDWTFALGTVGVTWMLVLVLPDFSDDKTPLNALLISLGVASVVSALILKSKTDPSVLIRAGMIHSREIHAGGFFLIGSGPLIIYWSRHITQKPERFFWLFFSSALIAGGFLSNANVLTGVMLQNTLYFRYANFVLGLLSGAALLRFLANRSDGRSYALSGIALMLLWTFFNMKSAAEKIYLVAGLPQSWESAFQWINTNTPIDAKVLTLSPEISKLLPLYSHATLEVSDGFPVLSSISTEENLRRMGILLKTLSARAPQLLADRWVNEYPEHVSQLMLTGKIPLGQMPLESRWENFLLHWAFIHDAQGQDRMKENILAYTQQAAPLNEDYYVWLNTADRPYLQRAADTRSDFSLVYKNEDVTLYHHGLQKTISQAAAAVPR